MINKIKNYGYKPPVIKETDYIFGGKKIPDEVLQENGNWLTFLPLFEKQQIGGVETYACTNFATSSIIETIQKRRFNEDKNWSDRAFAIGSGTDPEQGGNDPSSVAYYAHKTGLLKEELLPFNVQTVEEYYTPKPLTEELKNEEKKFLEEYQLNYEFVFTGANPDKHKLLKECLRYSPLGVSVHAWKQDENGVHYKNPEDRDNHFVVLYAFDELLNAYMVFDSYENNLKMLRADYDFGVAMRYYITKKPKIELTVEKKNIFSGLAEIFRRFWRKLFDPGSLGAARANGWAVFRRIHIKDFCEMCEIKGSLLKPLELHHIKRFVDNPELELDPNNVITVCRPCHLRYAHLGSFQSYCLEIKEEAERWAEKRRNRP